MTTAMTTTKKKAVRNLEGLTYREWLDTAGVSNTHKHFAMWRENKNPCAVAEAIAKKPDSKMAAEGAGENPMRLETKITIGVGVGVVAVGGITAAVYWWKHRKGTVANPVPVDLRSNPTTNMTLTLKPGMFFKVMLPAGDWTVSEGASKPPVMVVSSGVGFMMFNMTPGSSGQSGDILFLQGQTTLAMKVISQ